SFAQIRRTQNQAGQHKRWIHLQNFLKLRDGSVVVPSKVVEVSHVEIHGQRERIQLQGAICFLNGLLLSLLYQEPETEPVMRARRMGTEIDGVAEIPLRGIPIPIEVQADQSYRQMRVGKGRPHLDSLRRRGFRLRKRLLGRQYTKHC